MSVVLGLDLATRKCGWCVGAGFDLPQCSAFLLDDCGDDIGKMLEQLDEHLGFIMDRMQPGLVIFEAPILPSGGKGGQSVMGSAMLRRKLFNLAGHVEFMSRQRAVQYVEGSVTALKRELTGSSKASKTDMVTAALKCGINLPETLAAGREDAADAFAAWLLGIRMIDRKLSEQWDKRLWSARGALV